MYTTSYNKAFEQPKYALNASGSGNGGAPTALRPPSLNTSGGAGGPVSPDRRKEIRQFQPERSTSPIYAHNTEQPFPQFSPKGHIPCYQGFVPGQRSMHGSTFGKTTENCKAQFQQ